MFLTIKFNRKTAVSIILGVAVVLILLIVIFSRSSSEEVFKSGNITAQSDRIEFLSGLGWEIDANSETEEIILIPREFNEVYSEYNNLQLNQGYDLSNYCGTEVAMYTYSVTNYKSDENIIVSLYIYKGTVVGGDIHSTTLGGFMHGIK